MHLLRTRRGLALGFVVLALVGAACGKAATASEGGGSSSGSGSGTSTGSSGASGGSGYGGGGIMATTVLEEPDNGFTFSPSTVKVTRGQTITLVNVSDAAHTFTVTGQGIDIETLPGKTAKVTIDLPPGTLPVRLPFPRVDGHEGDLGGQTLIDGARSTPITRCVVRHRRDRNVAGVVRCWMGSREEERAGCLS